MKKKLLQNLLDILKTDSISSMNQYKNQIVNNILPNLQLMPDSKSDLFSKEHLIKDIDNYIENPNDFYKNQLLTQIEILNSF